MSGNGYGGRKSSTTWWDFCVPVCKNKNKYFMNNQNHKPKRDWTPTASIYFGIASVFLWEFSIIPILAVVFGVIAIIGGTQNKWKTLIGIALGIIFLVLRISHGYIDRGFDVGTSVVNQNTNTSININNLQQKIDTIWTNGETVEQAIKNGEIMNSEKNEADILYKKKWDTVCFNLKEAIRMYGPGHMPYMEGCN